MSNNLYKLDSKFNQFEEMEYWSSKSRTEESDPNINQGPIQLNNTDSNIRPIIRNNAGQAWDETKSIINLDMLQSSPPTEPIGKTGFLKYSAKWELANIQAISANMKKVDHIHRVMTELFWVKARP